MATLDQLYTRIILDLDRDDMDASEALDQAKIDAVADAIDQYRMEQFWFNRASGSGNTAASTATISMPSGIRYPDMCTINSGGYDERLVKVPLNDIWHRDETGYPQTWAENEGVIQLWPIPDAVYTISVYGLTSDGVPGSGASSTVWTTEAYNLILNAAKRILCEGPLRDPEGAGLAHAAEQRHLNALRRETMRRGQAPLKSDMPFGSRRSFNINRGF